MIGIFDSGLGGLTVLRRVRRQLPDEELLYFADQAHVPYGDKSVEELRAYLEQCIAYLTACEVDAIVMGCNTSCAVAARFGYPSTNVPILDLIETAAQVVAASGARRVGVLATAATVRSGAYADAIRRLAPEIHVQEVAAPALVPLVEAGHREGSEVRSAVAQACSRFERPLDAIVLACTHYPLLDAIFAEVLGDEILRIDPSEAQARRTVAFARTLPNDRRSRAQRPGRTRYVTSGNLAAFRENLAAILGPSDDVEQAEEESDGDQSEGNAGDHLSDRVSFEIHT